MGIIMTNYKSVFTSLLLLPTICGNICTMEERKTNLTDLPLNIAFKIAKHMLHPTHPTGDRFHKQSEKFKVTLDSDKNGESLHMSKNPRGDNLAIGSNDGHILICGIVDNHIDAFKGHNNSVTYLTWNPTGDCLASASLDGTVKIWSKDGRRLNTFEPTGPVRFLRWDATGNHLASTSVDNKLAIFSAKKYEQKIEVLLASIARRSQSPVHFWQIFFNIVAPKPTPIFSCTIS